MKDTYDIILEGLMKGGYSETQSEELIAKLLEESRAIDELRDNLSQLFNN